jgi:hypothetical protein
VLKVGKPSYLYFNYESKYTKPWLAAQDKCEYKAVVRPDKDLTLRVDL